jgi:hypothetical protein
MVMSSLIQHLPWLRITAALVGWIVLPGGALEGGSHQALRLGGEHASAPLDTIRPASVGPLDQGSLVPGYRLAVVDVPPPPPFDVAAGLPALTGDAPLAEPTCPLEVRAIIVAERAADTFAMVASDEGSSLIRKGAGVRAGGRSMAVVDIESDAVVLRSGTTTVRCGLE